MRWNTASEARARCPELLTVLELFCAQLRAFATDVTHVPAAGEALVRQQASAAPTEMPTPPLGHGGTRTSIHLAIRPREYQAKRAKSRRAALSRYGGC